MWRVGVCVVEGRLDVRGNQWLRCRGRLGVIVRGCCVCGGCLWVVSGEVGCVKWLLTLPSYDSLQYTSASRGTACLQI